MGKENLAIFLVIALYLLYMIDIIIRIKDKRRRKHSKRDFLLSVIFQQLNKNTMATSVNSITLNDVAPHTGLIVLTDNYGNQYSGTLSNAVLSGFDPAQDTVTVDANNPNQLDVQSVSETGGTMATLTGDWTSSGNVDVRPNPDPSKPGSVSIADGEVKTGVSCQVTIINKVSRTFALQVNF